MRSSRNQPPGTAYDRFGIAAEFGSPEALQKATRAARREGYTRLSAHSPFPVEGVAEDCGFRFNWLPILTFFAGIGGAALGYFVQWYASVISYPLNVGGRPLHSWPSFVPITFEMGVLVASLTTVALLLLLSGLPRVYHPLFNVPMMGRGSGRPGTSGGMTRGGFVLCIESRDPGFHPTLTRKFLERLMPQEISDVPW